MITVTHLSKHFTLHILGGKHIEACRDISFQVDTGKFLGLSGPSGAGKSSILKCIYRTYLPSQGSISYQSAAYGPVDLATLDDRQVITLRNQEMGYVAQFLKVIPRVSALQVVMEPLITRNGLPREKAREKAAHLLTRLHIPASLFDAYPATFSGGEQQRINIARAICWQPRLLLLDEPTASLDSGSVDTVMELFQELRQRGTTMIGIFHDQQLMQDVTDQVYQLN